MVAVCGFEIWADLSLLSLQGVPARHGEGCVINVRQQAPAHFRPIAACLNFCMCVSYQTAMRTATALLRMQPLICIVCIQACRVVDRATHVIMTRPHLLISLCCLPVDNEGQVGIRRGLGLLLVMMSLC